MIESAAQLDAPTLLVTLTGDDRPGVTSRPVQRPRRDAGAEVLDVEQVVVRGQLTLAVLLTAGRERAACAPPPLDVADGART